jgi:hypothetical protein
MASSGHVIPHVEPKRGRQTKLTYELIEELCGHLRDGNYIKTACALSGISPRTYFHWRRIARNARHPSRLQLHFLRAIERAEAEAEDFHVRQLKDAAKAGDLRASMFFLERARRDRWGRDVSPDADRPSRTEAPTVTQQVLVVPSVITDIHEWSRQAQAVAAEVDLEIAKANDEIERRWEQLKRDELPRLRHEVREEIRREQLAEQNQAQARAGKLLTGRRR